MKSDYEYILLPLLEWIIEHPGLTIHQHEQVIRSLSWDERLSAPSAAELTWKLRYLELCGEVYTEGTIGKLRWYAVVKTRVAFDRQLLSVEEF